MKPSTFLLSLFIINSSFLASYFSTELISSLNPVFLGVSEFFLGVFYYLNTILRDVRNVFDIEVTL